MNEQEALVNAILRSSRIRNRIVVLCEGDILPLGEGGAPSPQMYGRLEHIPDANFYKNCVPRDWHNYRLPQFFTCGGRSHVLSVYDRLIEHHQVDTKASYLTPEKLYALVDLDLQCDRMPTGYPWETTEAVHTALYQDGLVKGDPDENHRIWVTALIHKEAFFVLPSVTPAWTDGAIPYFRNAPLDLRVLHEAVAQRLPTDGDVAGHLDVVAARLARFDAGTALGWTSGESICTAWRAAVAQADADSYGRLLRALLSVAKVKPVWSEITPDPLWGSAISAENFRDQLELKIADVIARTAPADHPLSYFFAWLKHRR